MSKETIKVVEIDTNPAVKSLKDLRKELLEYKNQMANLEEGSDAFLEIANKAGEVKHQIDEINQSIKGASADFGDMVGNVTNVAAGITGAFQAVAGGLQAIGVESEAIDKTIVKMQGLMAVTQGLSAIDDGIKSFDKLSTSIKGSSTAMKAFKIISNPVVLAGVAAVVVTIGAAWNKWGDSIRKNLPWLDEWIKKLDGTTEAELERLKERQDAFDEYYNKIQEAAEDIREKRALEVLKPEVVTKIQNYKDDILLLEAQVADFQKLMNENQNNRSIWESYNQQGIALQERIKEIKNEINDLYNNPIYRKTTTPTTPTTPTIPVEDNNVIEPFEGIVDITDEITKKLQDKYDIQLEQLKRSNKEKEEYLTAEIEIERKRLSLYTEGSLEYEKQLTHIFNLENELKELTETSTEVLREKTEEVREMGNAIFENLKSTVDMFADSSLGISNGWIESLNQFQTVFTMTMDTVDKKGKATWQDYGNIATTALSGIGSVLNTLSQEQDASTEEGFKKTKQFQIAATIMNMLSGIMNAWTSAMSPSNAWMTVAGQIAMGTAMSGMIAGIGAAQIEKIKNATMSSANPNTNINAKSVNSMIIPPVQFSSAVQGASTEGSIKDTKVYVTESDIVNTMSKVKVQESENTY